MPEMELVRIQVQQKQDKLRCIASIQLNITEKFTKNINTFKGYDMTSIGTNNSIELPLEYYFPNSIGDGRGNEQYSMAAGACREPGCSCQSFVVKDSHNAQCTMV